MLHRTSRPGIYRYVSKQPAFIDQELVYKGRLRAAFKTAKTDLVLLDTLNFGEVLFMNGEVQSSSEDERIYHESLVLPAMIGARGVDCLLLGGGEGCAARDLFRWGARRVIQYDYDEEAVRWAKTSLAHWNGGVYNNPNLTVIYADACDALRAGHTYNTIVVDLFDPTSGSIEWFLDILLGAVRCLRSNTGSLTAYIGDAPGPEDNTVQVEIVRRLCAALPDAFVHPYRVYIPSFAGEACFVLIAPGGPVTVDKFPDWNGTGVTVAGEPVYMDAVNWLRAASWTAGSPAFFKELSGKYALSCAALAANSAENEESS